MEFIEHSLKLVPVPYLHLSFTIFKTIWDAVKEVQASREQFRVLGESVAQLLETLDKHFRSGKLSEDATSEALSDLENLLKDISAYIQKQSSLGFFKLFILKEDRLAAIDTFHRRISTSINAFQIVTLMDIHRWQSRNEEARLTDQERLHLHLRQLEANQRLLIEALDIPQSNPLAIMATVRRRVDEKRGDQEELRFLNHSLRYLTTASGQQVDVQPWTITSFDVELGPLIGAGGFGKVYRGIWNHTDVALKVMKNIGDIVPRAAAVRREVDTWSKLRHPNILQFLGANILDDEPFLVMPLIEGGNARDYVDNNPDCNRLKIVQQISLGLTYLHSQNVIHGDLKAVNVLIDGAERALLCDFGLARIKADVNSRTANMETNSLQGSQNWMAPELFEGRSLRMPCDIYSFAMTLYEIYTGEIPFGNIAPSQIPKLIVKRNARPERPNEDEAPYLTDDTWVLAQHCWTRDPTDRPLSSAICETLTALLNSSRHRQSSFAESQIQPAPSAYISARSNPSSTTNASAYSSSKTYTPNPSSLEISNKTTRSYESMFKFPSFAISLPLLPKKDPHKKIVIAFDVGTTYSGISYSILETGQNPEIKGVTTFSDQVTGSSKIPTTIYYDRSGNVRAIGAETLVGEVTKLAEAKGWIKVKWFKLQLWPHIFPGQSTGDKQGSLPSNKQPEDVLSDYLRYLYQCAVTYIQKTHVNWQELSSCVDRQEANFILSYPNGWNGVQELMSKAAVKAGLVSDTVLGRARLSFVTEGEASLCFVMNHGIPNLFPEREEGVVVIVDAGDYMINISTYIRKPDSRRLSFEEVTQPQRHLCGSIFVSSEARVFFQKLLVDSKFKNHVETIVQSFDRTTKFRFKDSQQPEYIMFGSVKDNDKRRNIKNGQLKLSGSDIATFFEPSIDCIVKSVKDQRKTLRKEVTNVILIGDLSASEWLYRRVTDAFKPLGYSVIRPNYYVNKAVADGALLHHFETII